MSDRVHIPYYQHELNRIVDGNNIVFLDDEANNFPCWIMHDVVLVRCNCGKWSGINNHTISADGEVNASFYHSNDVDGCGWHVMLHLDEYKERGGKERGRLR